MSNDVSIQVIHGKEVPAVTSLQVAKAFGKEHKNVLRDIKEVVSKSPEMFTALNFELSEYTDPTGRRLPMHILSKDGFVLLVMGYTGEKAMALKVAYIAQFNAMEEQLRAGLPDFTDPVASARAWANEFEAKKAALAENQRLQLENAEQAKTISKQADTIDDLEVALGDNSDWKQVKAIVWLRVYFIDTSTSTLARIGKVLTRMSRHYGVEIRKAPDSQWGTVNVYHVDIIDKFHDALEEDPTLLADIRK